MFRSSGTLPTYSKTWSVCCGRRQPNPTKKRIGEWWSQIDKWRARKSLSYTRNKDVIMPQHALERLYALTKDRDTYITTEVGQHQMWAAQFYRI